MKTNKVNQYKEEFGVACPKRYKEKLDNFAWIRKNKLYEANKAIKDIEQEYEKKLIKAHNLLKHAEEWWMGAPGLIWFLEKNNLPMDSSLIQDMTGFEEEYKLFLLDMLSEEEKEEE